MKINYLSYSKAESLALSAQYLKGSPLQLGGIIDHIVVAPHSRIIQWAFVSDLLSGSTPYVANYVHNDRYNVIIISLRPDAPSGFVITDLRSHLHEIEQSRQERVTIIEADKH